MLTHLELNGLRDELRGDRVLSVYLNGAVEDPASRHAWRVRLDHALKELRSTLAQASHQERTKFEECVTLLESQLAQFDGAVGAPGWAAFITSGRVHLAERVPASMPTMAAWKLGPCVAPYIRALKQSRPVILVLADAVSARVYRYYLSDLTHLKTFRARVRGHSPLHMGDAPRAGFHPGVRGSTGRDVASRALRDGTHRMLSRVAAAVTRLAGNEGWMLTGGIPQVSKRLASELEKLAPSRVMALPKLDVHASEADLVAAARKGASSLRDALDLRLLGEIAQHAEENGAATLGPEKTHEAVAASRIDVLLFTLKYLEEHALELEDEVRAAIDQRAMVEELSRDAAARLDECGGIAARLRYRVPASANSEREATLTGV